MSDRTLVVFVKEPRPGSVKTRLAAAVGPEAAAALYRALAEHVLEATTPVPGEYERLVFFDPPEARRDALRMAARRVACARRPGRPGRAPGRRLRAGVRPRRLARGDRRLRRARGQRETALRALAALDGGGRRARPGAGRRLLPDRAARGRIPSSFARHRLEHAGRAAADARARGGRRARGARSSSRCATSTRSRTCAPSGRVSSVAWPTRPELLRALGRALRPSGVGSRRRR